MTTPETGSVELEQLAPSVVESAVESDECQLAESDIRELPAYSFDSDDETLVGIGDSGSPDSSTVRHFDSSDRTLVGIGPAERAERAKLAKLAELAELAELDKLAEVAELAELARLAERAELADQSPQAEATPESVPMPHSEPPGPFVSGDDDDETALCLPMQKGGPWLLLPAVLVAAAAFAVVRGVVPHSTAPRLHAAAIAAPSPLANELRTSLARFETAAAVSEEPAALTTSSVRAREVPEPAASPPTAPRGKPPELHAGAKSASVEPALGVLDASSNPPSSLVLDGRPLGKTPRVVQLSTGPHTVVFVHPERGRMSVTVNVRAGRTTSASADF